MKPFLLISILSLLFIPSLLWAQERCAFDQYRELQQKAGKKVSDKQFENWLKEKASHAKFKAHARKSDEPFMIPVVVHVVHSGEDLGVGTNISEEQILGQIAVINEDFQRLNADTLLTPPEFAAVAGSINLEFVLAKRDPEGNPSNGIVRVNGSKSVYNISDDALLKSESYWPAEDYLNIWVCDLIGDNLGYAQFPDIDLPGLENEPKENRLTDGVVIDYRSFGSSDKGSFGNLRVPYDKGRTATHEIGHFFGLLHIFATPGSCFDDDYIDDTPQQRTDYRGCPTHPVSSCSSVDMFQNFMDYTDDACMNLFTLGQAGRMQAVLDGALRRGSLLDAEGAFPVEGIVYDLAIVSINSPSLISCDERFTPRITLQNQGTGTFASFEIEYGVGNEVLGEAFVTVDSLATGQQLLLPLLPITVGEGMYDFFVNVTLLDGVDFRTVNNSRKKFFVIDNQRNIAPFIEKFEVNSLEETQWTSISFDAAQTWEVEDLGDLGSSAFINLHNYSATGAKDWLISPVLDFSSTTEAALKFKVSHGKFEYVIDTVTGSNMMDSLVLESYSDSLSVFVSADCGNSFTEIYSGSSDDFMVKTTKEYWEPSTEADWKEFTLDLSQYAGSSDVRIAFVSTNGYGNNIFIDDVELFVQSANSLVDIADDDILLFPNPTQHNFFKLGFNVSERQDVNLQVFNLNGQLIQENHLSNVLNQVYTINFEGKRSGVYFVKAKGSTVNSVQKLVVNH